MARKISFDVVAPQGDDVSPDKPAQPGNRPLLGGMLTPRQPSAVGAISHALGNIDERLQRAKEIEAKLLKGQVIVELDPDLVDQSFIRDRMETTAEQDEQFRQMIRAEGQSVPILVRPKSGETGRFEIAFGRRRLKAVRELGLPVRAVVRDLTDEQLVIAQGQENSGRTNLSFIERGLFAIRLEARGFQRDVIMSALNVDKTVLSKLISITSLVPAEIIEAVGPAPNFGRVRWEELSELFREKSNVIAAQKATEADGYSSLSSDERFEKLYEALRHKKPSSRPAPSPWLAADGARVAEINRTDKRLVLSFDNRAAPAFGEFIADRLQGLYDEYRKARG